MKKQKLNGNARACEIIFLSFSQKRIAEKTER